MPYVSDYNLQAPLRNDEVCTTIVVPSGKSSMRFYSDLTLYARKGLQNAEIPGTTPLNDGSASLPWPGGFGYDIAVSSGDRYTFITNLESGWLFVGFS